MFLLFQSYSTCALAMDTELVAHDDAEKKIPNTSLLTGMNGYVFWRKYDINFRRQADQSLRVASVFFPHLQI
jgi:hypothetical protein